MICDIHIQIQSTDQGVDVWLFLSIIYIPFFLYKLGMRTLKTEHCKILLLVPKDLVLLGLLGTFKLIRIIF